jgi:hypothetical protein
MGFKQVDTAIAVQGPGAIRSALEPWRGAVDEVVLRAVTASDGLEETVALVQAAKPV